MRQSRVAVISSYKNAFVTAEAIRTLAFSRGAVYLDESSDGRGKMPFPDILNELLARTDIVAIATRLGIIIGKRESQYTTARCPFHDDKKPSLALYREPGNPHYYCFACGARGGILDLVEKQRRLSRSDSLKWLAEEVGVPLDAVGRSLRGAAASASDFFLEWMRRNHSDEALRAFAQERRLDIAVLVGAGAFAVDLGSLNSAALSPAEHEALSRAGVLTYRRDQPRLVASGKQIVFPVDGKRGFIFRAAESRENEKGSRYRFSKGLRKSEILFGTRAAEEQIRDDQVPNGLFVVEGIIDALRLRSLGLPAVAVLGTNISRHQADLLEKLCASEPQPVIPAHLFFDADEAGRRAAPAAIRTLLTLNNPVPVDIIYPDQSGDPDELLAGLEPADALASLTQWASSALAVLAHHYSRLPLKSVLADLQTARPLLRVETLRYVAAQLAGRWLQIRDLADPSATFLGAAPDQNAAWLRDALDRAAGRQPAHDVALRPAHQPLAPSDDEADVYLRRAMRIAQSSNFRREYPFDWGGMSRFSLAASGTSIIAKALLADAERRPLRYAARRVPKEDGRTRLKAGPWPEDALLQQYVLSDLLRARSDVLGWYLEIPAVRLIRTTGPNPVMTGPDWLIPVGRPGNEPRVVSFAYQIDQEIVEGDSPPRREGMFVPYRECWQQFIDHLDGFVARQPLATDTYYAVRLDISGFFDNLPRFAVEDVLARAVNSAVERHFTGRDFASEVANLLRPETSLTDAENLTRAGFVTKWLCDQSFGYRYFDPADGSPAQVLNPTIGIPQGPDLSAYLANLALYPVDRAATKVIEGERASRSQDGSLADEAAVYGRYVDDMVIVSTSATLLARIESTIGEELRNRGLSTNAKHERTKALDRRRIREWLLGERGAAVLVSAGGEETPTTTRARVDDLLDVGPDTGRGHVLQLLHHDDLYSPRWSGPESGKIDSALKRLRTLRSVKLRYYDWVSAARWVLHSVVFQGRDAPLEEFASKLLARWEGIFDREEAVEQFGEAAGDRSARQEFLDLAPVLMLFDALERTIDSRYDRRQGYGDNETRHALRIGRERLTALIHEGDLPGVLLRRLHENAASVRGIHRVASMLKIQHYGIRSLAASASDILSKGAPVEVVGGSPYVERRFAINALAAAIQDRATPILQPPADHAAGSESPEQEPLLGVHEALARLLAGPASPDVDPLDSMAGVIGRWSQDLGLITGHALKGLESAATAIALINQFLVRPSDSLKGTDPKAALPAFVEVVSGLPEGVRLLSSRNHLVENLSDGSLKALAVPPGINSKAFFARADMALKAFAFSDENKPLLPQAALFGIEATQTREEGGEARIDQGPLAEFNCRVPETHRISVPEPEQRVDPGAVLPNDLRTFAAAYRDLTSLHTMAVQQSDKSLPVIETAEFSGAITPLHLLKPINEGSKWRYFGAEALLPVGAQAFVRLGADRLHSLAVHANGAHLWQVGFALADHLGYRGFARSSELDRLTVATLEPTDTLESVPFYVMQLTVPRLCGAYLGRSRFRIDPAAGLPKTIDRQLKRLEAIADGADPIANLAELLEAGAEARAAELLRDSPAPLEVAGALSTIFSALGRAAARSERIFTENLPAPVPFTRTDRRTVDLWLAAASRLEQLSPAPERMGLRTSANAMRVLALAKLAQALTLEVWALLTDQDWQHIGRWVPSLADFDLPDEALLIVTGGRQRSLPLHDQAVRLISALRTYASSGATARNSLDQITPLGWIVALATVTSMVELEPLPDAGEAEEAPRPELLSARGAGASIAHAGAASRLSDLLLNVAAYLSAGVEGEAADGFHEDEWPWSPFQQLVEGAAGALNAMTEAAALVGNLYSLQAKTVRSRLFQIADADERGYCLVLRKGEQENVAGWQIDRDSLRLTRPGDIETTEVSAGRFETIWSETVRDGRLIALSVGYRSLSDLAGLSEHRAGAEQTVVGALFEPTEKETQPAEGISPPTALSDAEAVKTISPIGSALNVETAVATAQAEPPQKQAKQAEDADLLLTTHVPERHALESSEMRAAAADVGNQDGASGQPAPTQSIRLDEESAVAELRRWWHAERARADQRLDGFKPVTIRVAILQMNINQVGHSFYHPVCETNGGQFSNWEVYLRTLRDEGLEARPSGSIFEAWRRALLTEALRRCDTLKVELLVLPEYSTRPDTIAWLAENLNSLAPRTNVLAGTFRLPSQSPPLDYYTGTDSLRQLSLGAVVPLVVPGEVAEGSLKGSRKGLIYSRLKKYPSTGLSEFIRPEEGSRPLQAVYETWPGHELAPERLRYVRDLICSEVFLAMAPANIYSSVKSLGELRQRFGHRIDEKAILDEVRADIAQIAIDTSPAIGRELARPRKTIIAVPAATTRAFDHHIFGEAGAKAAGLTTVFSNMSGGGRGESCFIGHYKSQCVEGSNVWGLQSPYHGRAPGIWTYRFEGGAALGPKETALVVADVNPIDTNVSKPARQIENHPITLVAHIPFFIDDNDGLVRRRSEDYARKVVALLKTSDKGAGTRSSCELDQKECSEIKRLAEELASVDKKCGESLRYRAGGAKAITMQPHAHPVLPLLTDWAFVEAPLLPVHIDVPPISSRDVEHDETPT